MSEYEVEKTKKMLVALLRMPPKPHSEMKLSKPKKAPKVKRNKRGRPKGSTHRDEV
jgi:hypothetical protein